MTAYHDSRLPEVDNNTAEPHRGHYKPAATISLLLISSMVIGGVQTSAQEKRKASKSAPITVEQVFENHVAAIGGNTAWATLKTIVTKGNIEIPTQNLFGTIEIYEKLPRKLLFVMHSDRVGTFKTGFDGVVGWSSDPQTGLRQLRGDELANVQLDANFRRDVDWREEYSRREFRGMTHVGPREAYIIKITSNAGASRTMYFDTQAYFKLREDFLGVTPQGTEPTQSYFFDYRQAKTSRVVLPFELRQKSPTFVSIIRIREVQLNTPIDDSVFAMPQK